LAVHLRNSGVIISGRSFWGGPSFRRTQMAIYQPPPPPVPVISLEDRIKTWPILAVHRMEEIEKVLLSFEERLNALGPKIGGQKSIFAPSTSTSASAGLDDPYHVQPKPAPFMPISPPVPLPAQPTPIPEPSVLPTRVSYGQTEQFAGKSIFAPAQPAQFTGVQQDPVPPYTPAGIVPNPVQPTIFAPANPPRP
jgi:hypothetical protein